MAAVLAAACVAPTVHSPSPLPIASAPSTPAPTSTASPRPTFPTPGPPTTLSPAEICAEVLRLQEVNYLGECSGVIRIGLRVDAEALAGQLRARYGDAVTLTVGHFPYPPPEDPERACLDVQPTVEEHAPLTAVVEVEGPIVGGSRYPGTVRLSNAGAVPYELQTSSNFSLYLFRPGEPETIGLSELGSSWGVGYGRTLEPGEAVELPATGGTASCDLVLGYVLPAGAYEVRALIDFQPVIDDPARHFWSDPTPVQVVDP